MLCEKCQKEHGGTFGSGRFCSMICAKSRVFSKDSKRKKSEANRKYFSNHPKIKKSIGNSIGRKRNGIRKKLKIKYLGNECYFCKSDKFILEGHRKDGIRHKDFYAMKEKEFISEIKSGKYINICKRCHLSIHWCMRYLKLSWKDMIKIFNKMTS